MFDWLANNWVSIVSPILLLLAATYAGFRSRQALFKYTRPWREGTARTAIQFLVDAVWRPYVHWFLLVGAYVAVHTSNLPSDAKNLADKVMGSLFVFSLVWLVIILSQRLIRFYLRKLPESIVLLSLNVTRITIAITAILTLLDMWGAPTQPITIALVAALFLAGLYLRDSITNLMAGIEISSGQHIKIGHFIKIESGETGFVSRITWTKTTITTNDGNAIIIPNIKLMHSVITNFSTVYKPLVGQAPPEPAEGMYRLIDIPAGRQAFDFSCGAKALQILLAYYGIDVREGDLIAELQSTSKGTSVKEMISYLHKRGLQVYAKCGVSLDGIRQFVAAGYPVIVLVQAWVERLMTLEEWGTEYNNGHYVIVIGFESGKVIFADPATISVHRTWMSEDEFVKRWHDIDPKTKARLEHFAMAVLEQKPASKALEHLG